MKIIIAICASILMTSFTFAQFNSQQQTLPYGSIRKLPIMVFCGSVQNINMKMSKFNEIPMVEGNAAIEIPNAGLVEGGMRLFMNPQTKSFTYVFYLQPPMVPNKAGIEACIQTVGKQLVPATQGKGIDSEQR